MKTEKLKMTKEGYEEQLEILEKLCKQFQENEQAMTRAYKNSSGDGAHDNAEFEELLGLERRLAKQINNQKEKIKNIEIINIELLEDDVINIGDTVKINMIFSEDDTEDMQIMLVGTDGKINENKVSINSPLGKAIYKQKIGSLNSYNVNNNKIFIEILEKVNLEEKVNAKSK